MPRGEGERGIVRHEIWWKRKRERGARKLKLIGMGEGERGVKEREGERGGERERER